MHPILSLLVLWFLAFMPGTFSLAKDFDQARVFAPVIYREVKNQVGIIQYLPEEKQYVVVVKTSPQQSESALRCHLAKAYHQDGLHVQFDGMIHEERMAPSYVQAYYVEITKIKPIHLIH